MTSRQNVMFAAVGIGLLLALASTFTVDQRERAVLFEFGEVKATDFGAGLHFKLPWQSIKKFDGRVLTLDNQSEDFLTFEKKNVRVDFFVKWRIADTSAYYRATGGDESVAMDRLAASVNRSLRDEFAQRTIQQALAAERAEFAKALAETNQEIQTTLGITVLDVRVKRIDFPDDVREKVYERMRAERTRVAADLRALGAEEAEKIRAAADQEAQVIVATAYGQGQQIRGEGDAKAAETYARAYGADPDFYRFYRSLRAYRESMRGKQDVLVLEPDSEFFRYFSGSGGAK